MSSPTSATAVRVTSDVPQASGQLAGETSKGILTDYIEAAMCEAIFERLENGDYFGSIPSCQGVWASEATVEQCRVELRSVFEEWIVFGFRFGHELPEVAGINLNFSTAPIDAEAD